MDALAYARELSSSPRCVGTAGERRAARFIVEELERLGYDVSEEDANYISWKWYRPLLIMTVSWLFMVIILLSGFLYPILSLTAVFLLTFSVGKILPALELRMAKGKTQNIIASGDEIKDWRLILTAHYDSSWTHGPYIQRNRERILRFGHIAGLTSLVYVFFLLARSILGSILRDPPITRILSFELVMTGPWIYPWLAFLIAFLFFSIYGTVVALGLRTDKPSLGADDNASGVAVLLEVASALDTQEMNLRTDFAFFSAEEAGLFGSRQWVMDHREDIDAERTLVLNLDSVGRGGKFFIVRGLGILPKKYSDDYLCGIVAGAAAELGLDFENAWMASSDHAEFLRRGFRACAVLRADSLRKSYPLRLLEAIYRNPVKAREQPIMSWIHSDDDTFENIDPQKIRESVDLVKRIVARINEDVP
ncbi:MAG: M28 family metallopeptidase [Thermoplasmata archaeon]